MKNVMRVSWRERSGAAPATPIASVRGPVGRLCLLLATIAVLALPAPASAEVTNPYGVAVIIGNRTYHHSDVPPVDYAHRDAQAFKRYVIDVLGFDPDNVIHLEDATRSEMLKALGDAEASMNDLQARLNILAPAGGSDVVVYYSGHGVPGRDGGASLLPADVPPQRVRRGSRALSSGSRGQDPRHRR